MKRTVDPDFDFLTTAELSAATGIAKKTLEGMRRKGEGPPCTRLGMHRNSKVVYFRKDIIRWLKANRYAWIALSRSNKAVAPSRSSPSIVPINHLGHLINATADGAGGETWISAWLAYAELSP